MKWVMVIFFFCSFTVFSLVQAEEPNVWDVAEKNITRLSPNDFKDLPLDIKKELIARRCTIPQMSTDLGLMSVIQGEFQKSGQKDWAVLCSNESFSTVLVFWNGSTKDVGEIARASDKGYLQGISDDKIGFSRYIRSASIKQIKSHHEPDDAPRLPSLDHDGIENVFYEKASEIYYFSKGKWLRLKGAD